MWDTTLQVIIIRVKNRVRTKFEILCIWIRFEIKSCIVFFYWSSKCKELKFFVRVDAFSSVNGVAFCNALDTGKSSLHPARLKKFHFKEKKIINPMACKRFRVQIPAGQNCEIYQFDVVIRFANASRKSRHCKCCSFRWELPFQNPKLHLTSVRIPKKKIIKSQVTSVPSLVIQ